MEIHSLSILFPALLAGSAVCACGGRSNPTAPSTPAPSRSTFTLSGTVTDDTATPQPIAGAAVRLDGGRAIQARTNHDGFYSLGVVGGNLYVLTVEADGFETASKPAPVAGDVRIDFRLRRPPQSSISGFVYEVVEGRQVPVADVWVQEGDLEREAHTDANGNFYIQGVHDGPDGLHFSKPGYEVRTLRITVEGHTSGIDVQLTRTMTVRATAGRHSSMGRD